MSALNHAFLRAYAKQRDQDSRVEYQATEQVDREEPRYAQSLPHSPQASLGAERASSPSAVAERPRVQVDHPLYVPRHDVPLPSRPLFSARVASAPPVHQPPPPVPPVSVSVASPFPQLYLDGQGDFPEEAPAPTSRAAQGSSQGFSQGFSQAPAPSRPAGRPPAAPVELVPAWEVDAFHWPRSCEIAWDAAHDEFAALGDQLAQVNQHGLRVLGVTSAVAHEGRTTMAMCLARAAADQGLRVLLLDADLNNPQLAPALGIDVRHDWTEVISEALPLDETAVASIEDRLTLIPLLSGASGRANLLRTSQFAQLVGQLAAVADLVIVDLPPIDSKSLPTARSGRPSPFDAAILVRDVRQTTIEQLRDARRLLDNLGIPSVGVLENFV